VESSDLTQCKKVRTIGLVRGGLKGEGGAPDCLASARWTSSSAGQVGRHVKCLRRE